MKTTGNVSFKKKLFHEIHHYKTATLHRILGGFQIQLFHTHIQRKFPKKLYQPPVREPKVSNSKINNLRLDVPIKNQLF